MRRDRLLLCVKRAVGAAMLCWISALAAPAFAQEAPPAACVAPDGTEDAAQWFRDEGGRLAEQQEFDESGVRDAIAAFQCAARLDPEDIQSLMAVGALSYGLGEALGDLDAADAGLSSAIQAASHQPLAQARLLAAHSRIVGQRGDQARAAELFGDAVAAAQGVGAPADAAAALMQLGEESLTYGDAATAGPFAEAAEALYAEIGDSAGQWRALQLKGDAHRQLRDRPAAEAALTRAHELAIEAEDLQLQMLSIVRLADLAAADSDYVKACPLYDQALELTSSMDEQEASQAQIGIAARKGSVGCDLLPGADP